MDIIRLRPIDWDGDEAVINLCREIEKGWITDGEAEYIGLNTVTMETVVLFPSLTAVVCGRDKYGPIIDEWSGMIDDIKEDSAGHYIEVIIGLT